MHIPSGRERIIRKTSSTAILLRVSAVDLLGQLWICSVSGSFGQTIPAALSYKVAAIVQIWVEHFIPRTRVRITLSLLFVIASRIAPGLGHGMFVKKKKKQTP